MFDIFFDFALEAREWFTDRVWNGQFFYYLFVLTFIVLLFLIEIVKNIVMCESKAKVFARFSLVALLVFFGSIYFSDKYRIDVFDILYAYFFYLVLFAIIRLFRFAYDNQCFL